MSNKYQVSVVMPVYNGVNYLKDALESIANQIDILFEIIIIDDCSTEDIYSVVQPYIKNKKFNVKYHKFKKNSGIAVALNYGISKAEGKYIARMDADDIAFNNRLIKQFNFLELNPDIALCSSSFQYINHEGKKGRRQSYSLKDKDIGKLLKFGNPLPHPTWMIKKNIIESLSGYREFQPSEDLDLILRLRKSKYKTHRLSDILLYFRESSINTTSTKGLLQRRMRRCIYKNFAWTIRATDHRINRML